jgi:hypothetical protein
MSKIIIPHPDYIDVPFDKQDKYPTGFNGLGVLPKVTRFKDAVDLIPKTDWKSLADQKQSQGSVSKLVTRIFNQGQEGSCVGNMATQMLETRHALEFGKKNVVQLSAISMYKQIGSSPNSGADVGDAMARGLDTGFVPLDNPENRARFGDVVMPHTGFRTPYPANWKETAKNFRYDEYFEIQSVEELVTALLKDFGVGVGRAGHSILYCDVFFDGTTMYILYVNSWGEWGIAAGDFDYGFGLDSARLFNQSADWCYAARTTVIPAHLEKQFALAT